MMMKNKPSHDSTLRHQWTGEKKSFTAPQNPENPDSAPYWLGKS
jgi:hypothetical protein